MKVSWKFHESYTNFLTSTKLTEWNLLASTVLQWNVSVSWDFENIRTRSLVEAAWDSENIRTGSLVEPVDSEILPSGTLVEAGTLKISGLEV